MSCPFYMLYLSASANEESRKTRTNSTNEEVLERREKYFEERKQTIDIDVPYLKHIFYDVQQERFPISGIKISDLFCASIL